MEQVLQNASKSTIEASLDQAVVNGFEAARMLIRDHGIEMKATGAPFFETDVKGQLLWEEYLNGFSTPETRKYHDCSCCRAFFTRYAKVVTMDKSTYKTRSALFPQDLSSIHPEFAAGFGRIRDIVEGARINRVFYSSERSLGDAANGGWDHFYSHQLTHAGGNATKTAKQNMAESLEDHRIMRAGLNSFPVALYEKGLAIFQADAQLKHYPKQIELLTWAIELQLFKSMTEDRRTIDNRYWYEVATRGKSSSHLAQTVTGVYLKTLGIGDAETAKVNFIANVDPKDYLRPKALPTEGNVRHAESVIAKLGAEKSLHRRSLRRDELDASRAVWVPPQEEAPASQGVFGHLQTKQSSQKVSDVTKVEGGPITLRTFLKNILPGAEKVEILIPNASRNFVSMTTAVDPTAPNIMKWVNGICTYGYVEPMRADVWGLKAFSYADVMQVIRRPEEWDEILKVDEVPSVLFVLTEGHDTARSGSAIFPENLSPEFFAIRATIEQFSNTTYMQDKSAGLVAWSASGSATNLRVTSAKGTLVTTYVIDRIE